MEIILRENVEHLGRVGDIVRVKDGYARNHLIPYGKAYVATAKGRMWWDEYQLETPLVGPVLSSHYYAQFCQSLGEVAAGAGQAIAQACDQTGFFSPGSVAAGVVFLETKHENDCL